MLAAPEVSPEFLLVAACATWPPSVDRTETIHNASKQDLDWNRLLRIAKRHEMFGLLDDGLRRASIVVPSEIKSEIRAQATVLVRENLVLAAEAANLQKLFSAADLPVLSIKGTSLALLAYGNLGLRGAKDIDLLVPHDSLEPALALVENAGYQRVDPPLGISAQTLQLLTQIRKDYCYFNESNGVHIEVHWRLCLNPYAMDDTTVFSASQKVPVTQSIGLRTLGEEDLFTYLCVHGARHWWYQLKWLADIRALLGATTKGPERLYRAAEARGGGRSAAQAMLLCQQLLHMPLPWELSKLLLRNRKAQWLQRTALNAMDVERGDREHRKKRFGTTRGSLSVFLLGKGWRYRLAELRQLMNSTTDVLMVPLPKRLSFLYPFLRFPLWAWRNVCQQVRN